MLFFSIKAPKSEVWQVWHFVTCKTVWQALRALDVSAGGPELGLQVWLVDQSAVMLHQPFRSNWINGNMMDRHLNISGVIRSTFDTTGFWHFVGKALSYVENLKRVLIHIIWLTQTRQYLKLRKSEAGRWPQAMWHRGHHTDPVLKDRSITHSSKHPNRVLTLHSDISHWSKAGLTQVVVRTGESSTSLQCPLAVPIWVITLAKERSNYWSFLMHTFHYSFSLTSGLHLMTPYHYM